MRDMESEIFEELKKTNALLEKLIKRQQPLINISGAEVRVSDGAVKRLLNRIFPESGEEGT